jgi:tRNA uridine 5-carbamoylmethylation protein Kti12
MYIFRGLPGSGKTHAAEALREELKNSEIRVAHYEADMFHMKWDDSANKLTYQYNPYMKIVAHRWCERMIEDAMEDGWTVIVSNTFTQYWEMIPYLILARDFGYRVKVITCKGEWPNIHNVPDDVIQKMRERWED